jgi:hypothetical protein
MILTIDKLVELNACSRGREWFLNYAKTLDANTGVCSAVDTIKELLKQDKFDWANWTIAHLLNNDNKVRYAIFAAREVLAIYENKYPGDLRTRKAIEVAENYLKVKTADAADAARAATYAATYAAYAARAAARAAADAARAAARAAAYAAADAARAAYAAADAARAAYAAYAAAARAAYAADARAAYAADAADAAMKDKLILHGLTLLEDQETAV